MMDIATNFEDITIGRQTRPEAQNACATASPARPPLEPNRSAPGSPFEDDENGRQYLCDAHGSRATASPASTIVKPSSWLPGSPFPTTPSWKWYAGASAVGIASAMAAAIGLNALTTPKPIVAAAAVQETIAIKTDRDDPRPVRTIPIVPTPVVAAPIVVPPPAPEPAPPSTLAQIEPTVRVHNPDVCVRHGGHREDYQRGSGWRGWRCVFQKKGK